MAGSSVPPPPKSGNGPYIALAVVMLLAMGGLIVWKLTSSEPTEIVEQKTLTPPPEEAPPVLDAAPPPPPPEEELAPTENAPAPEKKVASTGGGNTGCSGVCEGTLSAEGQSALRAKGGQARGCYNRALRQDATLTGKMTLSVRIGPTGNVCSASVIEDSLNDPAVATCVTQMFRSGKFPPPQGGCAQVNVPLNFVASQ